MSFCPKCGSQVGNDKNFCSNCGSPVNNTGASNYSQAPIQTVPRQAIPVQPLYTAPPAPSFSQTVAQKIRFSSIWWLVALILQYIGTALCLIYTIVSFAMYGISSSQPVNYGYSTYNSYNYSSLRSDDFSDIFLIVGIVLIALVIIMLIMAIVSTVKFSKNRRLSKQVLTNPSAVIVAYRTSHPVLLLVLNILFGGIFGIVAAIIELVTRNFVLNSTSQLMETNKY